MKSRQWIWMRKRWKFLWGQIQIGYNLEEWALPLSVQIYHDMMSCAFTYRVCVLCFYVAVHRWDEYKRQHP